MENRAAEMQTVQDCARSLEMAMLQEHKAAPTLCGTGVGTGQHRAGMGCVSAADFRLV